ncbi:serine acetyltransferase [Microcystis aeruginosa NIES-3806]|uniref:Serine acetyltransferase n=3 Tax=Microcystis TaxID=1125 RepID=A0AAD3B0G1_MICAE|nr:serine O-acetyltransferase [Microcystis aeruginosa]GCL55970.1 serine acetyltransferase [Microcystis aeruginosa NIES-3806]GCL59324.1 serine acetyltransferase [Microcystis aeruginosa NIES-3807]
MESRLVLSTLLADFKIIFERDPAARNWLEVLFCYPGLQALLCHRFAHWLYQIGIPFIPRLISHLARFLTGIEIHPGAQIGQGVFIDHGMGVVIGETAIVGDYALIYQGVTLGGTGKESGKRHPTLGENVVVGAGAKVLGNIYLGNNVRVGAGSVVLRDIPADCTVVGVPGRLIYRAGTRVQPLEHGDLPDSEAVAIRALVDRIEQLEKQVYELRLERSKEPDYRINCPVLAHLEEEEEASHSCCPGADRDIREFLERAVYPLESSDMIEDSFSSS